MQFAPTYHDYVLYNHGDGEGAKKYRARTFVPTGQEMDAVRRNKHAFGNKLEDVQMSCRSSSASRTSQNPDNTQDSTKAEAMNSSLLMDTSSSQSLPYDLSLIDIDISDYPSKVPSVNETVKR